MEDPPANSMKGPSEGDQNNDETVKPSADQGTKTKRQLSDEKYLNKKKQKIEDTEGELKKTKVECVELEKHNAYLKGNHGQLANEVKENREFIWKLLLTVGGQTYMLNTIEEKLTGNSGELPILHVDDNLMDNTSIGHQNNDHRVQLSADEEERNKGREASLKSCKRKEVVLNTSIGDEEKRQRKLASGKKSRDKKKQAVEDTERELEWWKARYVELDKQSSYFTGKLDQLKEDLKHMEQIKCLLLQIVARQTIMTTEFGQQFTGNSGGLPDLAQENQVLQTGNSGGLPDLAQQNQVLQTGNSGGLPDLAQQNQVLQTGNSGGCLSYLMTNRS